MITILILSGSLLLYMWIGMHYGFLSPEKFYPFEWNYKEGYLKLYKDKTKKNYLILGHRRSYAIRIKIKNPNGIGYIIKDAIILYRNSGGTSLGVYNRQYIFYDLLNRSYNSISKYSYVILDSKTNDYIDPETIIAINPRFNDGEKYPLIFNGNII